MMMNDELCGKEGVMDLVHAVCPGDHGSDLCLGNMVLLYAYHLFSTLR